MNGANRPDPMEAHPRGPTHGCLNHPHPDQCTIPHANYRARAACRWPGATIVGRGRWAVLSCGNRTIRLCVADAEATARLAVLDVRGCGRGCTRDHHLVDLDEPHVRNRPPKDLPATLAGN